MNTVSSLTGKVDVDLKNQKLEDRMKAVDECSATRLFNGVCHIWSEELNDMTEPKSKKGGESDTNSKPMPELSGDDEASEMNVIIAQNEAMTGITVNAESVDLGSDEGGDDTKAENKPHKYCTNNPWTDGEKKMAEKNYLEVRDMSNARTDRKRSVADFIVRKVHELQADDVTVIGVERDDVLPSEWTDLVHSLDPGILWAG